MTDDTKSRFDWNQSRTLQTSRIALLNILAK